MANFIRNTQVKAMTSIWTAKQKARELTDRTKEALVNREGQGTLDVVITVLISIVLGAPTSLWTALCCRPLPSASRICSITRADVWRNRRGVMPRRTFYQGGFLWRSERRSNGR